MSSNDRLVRSAPQKQIADDWEVLNDGWMPRRDITCDDIWLALGSTIQVARVAASEHMKGPGEDTDLDFVVDDWSAFIEQAHMNIQQGIETLQDKDCATTQAAEMVVSDLPDAFEEMRSPREAYDVLTQVESDYKRWAPDHLLTEDYDPSTEYHFAYPVEQPSGQQPVSADTPDTNGASYRMACVEGDSLSEVEMEMNDRLADDGKPTSLTVDRDEDLDVYYACTLLQRVADDLGGD